MITICFIASFLDGTNFQFVLRIRVEKREQNFIEERADALKQARVLFIAGARAEMHIENGFQNHAAKINRRARGIARAQTILREKRAVFARDAATIREQCFARVRVFDERDDAREQTLTDFTLLLALIVVRRESGLKPGRGVRRMRVYFIAHRADGLLNWRWGNFRFALAEK